MASLFRPCRRALLSLPSASKTLIPNLQNPCIDDARKVIGNPLVQTRSYVPELPRSTVDNYVLRLLRKEIEFEVEHCPMEPASHYYSYTIDGRPGERWIILKRKYQKEDIKIEVTMFDAVPIPKSANPYPGQAVWFCIIFIVSIRKGNSGDYLEFVCSAWEDRMEIKQVYMRTCERIPVEPYMGPEFKGLDDNLQFALYDFLRRRGIDDNLAVFLYAYIRSKERAEFIRWMETVKSYIEIE